MKRTWSNRKDGSTLVTRTWVSAKRRKYSPLEFPIEPLNEDVWNEILAFISPNKATILRMVCKYFRSEKFVIKDESGVEKKVKKVSKEAILGTNDPVYLHNLPGINLTKAKLDIIAKRSIYYNDEFNMYKMAVSCGIGIDNKKWREIGRYGCDAALHWVFEELPSTYVHSSPSIYVMCGILDRPDASCFKPEWQDKVNWTRAIPEWMSSGNIDSIRNWIKTRQPKGLQVWFPKPTTASFVEYMVRKIQMVDDQRNPVEVNISEFDLLYGLEEKPISQKVADEILAESLYTRLIHRRLHDVLLFLFNYIKQSIVPQRLMPLLLAYPDNSTNLIHKMIQTFPEHAYPCYTKVDIRNTAVQLSVSMGEQVSPCKANEETFTELTGIVIQ